MSESRREIAMQLASMSHYHSDRRSAMISRCGQRVLHAECEREKKHFTLERLHARDLKGVNGFEPAARMGTKGWTPIPTSFFKALKTKLQLSVIDGDNNGEARGNDFESERSKEGEKKI